MRFGSNALTISQHVKVWKSIVCACRCCEAGEKRDLWQRKYAPPTASIEALELYIQKRFYSVLSGTFRDATHRG